MPLRLPQSAILALGTPATVPLWGCILLQNRPNAAYEADSFTLITPYNAAL